MMLLGQATGRQDRAPLARANVRKDDITLHAWTVSVANYAVKPTKLLKTVDFDRKDLSRRLPRGPPKRSEVASELPC